MMEDLYLLLHIFSTVLQESLEFLPAELAARCMNECLWPVSGAAQAGVFLALDCSQLVRAAAVSHESRCLNHRRFPSFIQLGLNFQVWTVKLLHF